MLRLGTIVGCRITGVRLIQEQGDENVIELALLDDQGDYHRLVAAVDEDEVDFRRVDFVEE